MKYTPKHKKAVEILLECGYTSVNRGYERVLNLNGKGKEVKKRHPSILYTPKQLRDKLNKVATTRFHSFITLDGDIDLHLDEPHPEDKTKHKSRKNCKSVELEIKKFRKLDRSNKWYVRFIRFIFSME